MPRRTRAGKMGFRYRSPSIGQERNSLTESHVPDDFLEERIDRTRHLNLFPGARHEGRGGPTQDPVQLLYLILLGTRHGDWFSHCDWHEDKYMKYSKHSQH